MQFKMLTITSRAASSVRFFIVRRDSPVATAFHRHQTRFIATKHKALGK
jgi:hypothetical protein